MRCSDQLAKSSWKVLYFAMGQLLLLIIAINHSKYY